MHFQRVIALNFSLELMETVALTSTKACNSYTLSFEDPISIKSIKMVHTDQSIIDISLPSSDK